MNNLTVEDLAEDVLLNASDFISNQPDLFNADNAALTTISSNQNFRETVADHISNDPESYENLTQKESAEAIWPLYLKWAY